jgi:hypothetical protein
VWDAEGAYPTHDGLQSVPRSVASLCPPSTEQPSVVVNVHAGLVNELGPYDLTTALPLVPVPYPEAIKRAVSVRPVRNTIEHVNHHVENLNMSYDAERIARRFLVDVAFVSLGCG